MNKSIASLFLSFLFLIMPFLGNAVVDIKPDDASFRLEKTLTTSDFSKLDKKGLEKKVGRKLKLKEKIILKLIKRKIKKQQKKKSKKRTDGSDAGFGLGISAAGLLLGVLAFVTGAGAFAIISFLCGLVGLTVSMIAFEKYRALEDSGANRRTALAGVIIGMLVSVFWVVLIGIIFLALNVL